MIVERTIRVATPVASPVRATLEVTYTERRPGRVRAWVAKLLCRLAARIAGMRFQIRSAPTE